ncbi:MAG: DUF5611 family protein [Candidatus Lutacidiplasmatales archaeon]|nr:DUF5611 family protein [Thermoplasmata archaeon]
MQKYPVRADHRPNLAAPALAEIAKTHFDSGAVDGTVVVSTYGALTRLAASAAGRELEVEVTMNPKVSEDVARETIRRYNQFLEAVTGYSAKERAKRLRKSAAGSAAGE